MWRYVLCYVPRDFARGILKSVAFVRFAGGAAEEKALKLNKTDWGEWTAIVKPATLPTDDDDDVNPFPDFDLTNPLTWRKYRVLVTGYDTSLPQIDLKMALCRHFSSCGDIWRIDVFSSAADITMQGEGCVEKAVELNGSIMGERTLVVEPGATRGRWRTTNSDGESQPIGCLPSRRKMNEKMKDKDKRRRLS